MGAGGWHIKRHSLAAVGRSLTGAFPCFCPIPRRWLHDNAWRAKSAPNPPVRRHNQAVTTKPSQPWRQPVERNQFIERGPRPHERPFLFANKYFWHKRPAVIGPRLGRAISAGRHQREIVPGLRHGEFAIEREEVT